jgi:hypothetical protein
MFSYTDYLLIQGIEGVFIARDMAEIPMECGKIDYFFRVAFATF